MPFLQGNRADIFTSSVLKPNPGTPINWGHPTAQRFGGCWLMNEAGGYPLDVSGNARHTKAGAMAWKVGNEGWAFIGDGTTQWLDTDWTPTGLTGFTVLASFLPEASGGDDYLVDFSDGSKGVIFRYDSGNNRMEAAAFSGGSTTVLNTSAMSETDYHVCGFSCSPSSQFMSVDGVVDGGPIAGIASIDDATATLSIGAEYDGDNKWRGEISWVMIWERGLLLTEMISLSYRPFQMFF